MALRLDHPPADPQRGPPETVAATITEALRSADPPFRNLVGDATVLAGMRNRHSDAALSGAYVLDDEDFRERYRELGGIAHRD